MSTRLTGEKPRAVTPLLRVGNWFDYDSPGEAASLIEEGIVVYVETDEEATEVLRLLGLEECCIADRLSVSHGGPILCTH